MRIQNPWSVAGAWLLVLGITTVNAPAQTAFFGPQRPAPYVDEIAPTAAAAGSWGFFLKVTGAGFESGADVIWRLGGITTQLDAVVVNGAELTAWVLAELVARAGTATIAVRNPESPSIEESGALLLPITVPTASVILGQNSVIISPRPGGAVAADFNHDGKADLAIVYPCGTSDPTCISYNGAIEIFLGNGDGTFAALPPINVGMNPVGIAVGDFDRDGKLDLAVANQFSGNVSILIGKGDGTFTASAPVTVGTDPITVATGDFNGDGKLDLAVSNLGQTSLAGSISILLGNGDGTFTATASPATFMNPSGLAVADFNGDGKLDLLVTGAGTPDIDILLGKGNGTFATGPSPAAPAGSGFLGIADVNNDGRLDLLVELATGGIEVLLGKGNATFSSGPTSSEVDAISSGPLFGDFNGDGNVDIAVSVIVPPAFPGSPATYAYSILVGDGHGTFAQTTSNAVPVNFTGILGPMGDFNGDGRLDLATFNTVGGGTLAILTQQPVATLSTASLNFGKHNFGFFDPTQSVTLTAGAALQIGSIATTANFKLVTTHTSCPYGGGTLQPGRSCTVDVEFTPSGTGSFTGEVTLTDNSGGIAGSQQTISLTGTK